MEINNDYLRTGTAIGFRASRELCSNYLFYLAASLLLTDKIFTFIAHDVIQYNAINRSSYS